MTSPITDVYLEPDLQGVKYSLNPVTATSEAILNVLLQKHLYVHCEQIPLFCALNLPSSFMI